MNPAVKLLLLSLAVWCGLRNPADAQENAERVEKARQLLERIRADLERRAPADSATAALPAAEYKPSRYRDKGAWEATSRITLRNQRIRYELKHWVVVESKEGDRCFAPEGATGLGMEAPSRANWYSNNFLELQVDGTTPLRTSRPRFRKLDPAGGRAAVEAVWETPKIAAQFVMSLGADDEHLTLHYRLRPAADVKHVKLGFRSYPGHYPEPRSRRAATALRDLAAPISVALPEQERALVLYDALDVAPCDCCGIRISDAGQDETRLDVHDYAVTVWLTFREARPDIQGEVRLWDWRRASVNQAMQTILE